jgi:aspartate/glutamate racemase
MPSEFPAGVEVVPDLAEGAMEALNAGDIERHDAIVVESAQRLVAQGCDVIALAQFSMARAQDAVRRVVQVPVLTTPASAVVALRRRLGVEYPLNSPGF